MELMTPQIPQLVWTMVIFVLLLLILRKFAWTPILMSLNEREKRIEDSINAAEQARDEARAQVEQQQQMLESARQEAQNIIDRSRIAAEKTKEEILAQARAEVEQLLARTKGEIQLSRDKAIQEIQTLAVELSILATRKLIQKSLTVSDHKAIVEKSIQELGEFK